MERSVMKDFHRLVTVVDSMSDGQVKITDHDDDNLESFMIEIHPNGGPYQWGKFVFAISELQGYPEVAPVVNCLTDIYHPNVDVTYQDDDTSNVCVTTLDDWSGSNTFEDLVQSLLFIFYHPNLSDPLCPFFDCGINEERFLAQVQLSLFAQLGYDDGVEHEFRTINYHPPDGGDPDDYMIIYSLEETPPGLPPSMPDVDDDEEEEEVDEEEQEEVEDDGASGGEKVEEQVEGVKEEGNVKGLLSRLMPTRVNFQESHSMQEGIKGDGHFWDAVKIPTELIGRAVCKEVAVATVAVMLDALFIR